MRAPTPTRRELVLALVAALALAAWPVRAGLFDASRVLLGVDTAMAVLPWSAALGAPKDGAPARPRNPALSDQGVVFYPYYRWVADSLLALDPPLWNPLVHVGAPGVGNPQAGVLDPQVWLLVALEALFGRAGFDWGFALLAWLRLAAAGLGAYLLARKLGLGCSGAALAGVSNGLAGYLVLWLGAPLGHVPPYLPWLLLALEGVGGARPRRAAAGAALTLALAIHGGHPETAFFVGLAGGLWALALLGADRRAGLRALGALALGTAAGAAQLVPFVEYLSRSSAHAVRASVARGLTLDLVALGALVVLVGLGLLWRERGSGPVAGEPARDEASGSVGERALARGAASARAGIALSVVGLSLASGGVALLLRARGLPQTAVLALLADFHGSPGAGGYFGAGTYLEEASAWMPLATLALAASALFSARGPLARRRLVALVALAAWLLALRAPGAVDVYRRVPLLGLGETVRLASVSSLFLALLAGEALQAARAAPRAAGALTVLSLCLALAWERPGAPPPAQPRAQEDENFGLLLAPPPLLDGASAPLEGWVHPRVDLARVAVRVERLDARGRALAGSALELPALLVGEPSQAARQGEPERLARVPQGARIFRGEHLQANRLEPGAWLFSVALFAPGEDAPIDVRAVAASLVERRSRTSRTTLALSAAALLLVGLAPLGALTRAALVLVALVQGLVFARGQNPAVPRAEVFPHTATERVLARELGLGRFFSDPLVLPPNTGLVRGLRALDGYDGMDPASMGAFRRYVLPAGVNPLLGWHARGVRLDAPAFRLLGVSVLVLAQPLEAPGFELVAGPAGASEWAECYVYRARAPLPRAFCVREVVAPAELVARIADFDPLAVACTTSTWRPAQPFTSAAVDGLELRGNLELRLRARLDGDGLLVVTELDFPGWTASVDGEPRAIIDADAIFRGVPLSAGEHEVVLRYRPKSLAIGAALALAALAAIGWLALRR